METKTLRQILPWSTEFKVFWKASGPFRYALTSREFPPILLEPEEWLFSDNLSDLIKELMQWEKRGMAIIEAPFNPRSTKTLKPEELSPWKINHFPEEWESAVCPLFTPVGHLTHEAVSRSLSQEAADIENAFFESLAEYIDTIGYVLLKPDPVFSRTHACINDYLKEWEEDESDDD
ncbi:MAG: hypothetical protein V1793_10660 [Pseudomonadota bacterium]